MRYTSSTYVYLYVGTMVRLHYLWANLDRLIRLHSSVSTDLAFATRELALVACARM